ncbi:MAG: DnaA/Hda family protein, partial [Pirellulaceae bacterium]
MFALPLLATDAINGSDAPIVSGAGRPFLAGRENALLRILVAEGEVCAAYNPVVLFGPSGIGKTHLVRGFVDRFQMLVGGRKPWVITGSDFARLYASAVELDSLPELRERWNAAGMVALDCLEELAPKSAAQRELQQLADDCVDRGTLLLCACRLPPDDWSWMLPGLRSRLMGGLVIPIVPPQAATRRAMVEQLAAERGLRLSEETVEALTAGGDHAAPVLSNYPLLRGAICQLAHNPADATPVGTRSRKGSAPRSGSTRPTTASQHENTRRIIKVVARHYELKQSELLGASRRKTVVQARGMAIYLTRSVYGVSFEQIGRSLGNRDHTTV